MKLSNTTKIVLVIFCFVIAIIGFMIKLPVPFRRMDKQMHTFFYFLAAGFLNLLFAKRNVIKHAVIFLFLYLFGEVIEYAQAYSNNFFHKRIHGRYDPADIQANLRGLILFSVIWLIYIAILFASGKLKYKKVENR